jgi:phosphopantothenoylcysteine decarboxylase / phosphopantothenate---cysteine ligase
LDPVRYLTNRSSGKMGYAIAEAAARRGARVILVSGPTALDTPSGVERINVRSAEEMHRAVLDKFPGSSIAIFAAAVADYRPTVPQAQKIKRDNEPFTLSLEPTPDILASVAHNKGGQIIVGFAAETQNLAENARKKLAAKNADLIVANNVTAEGAGFDLETNVVTLFARDGRELPLPRMEKREIAHHILDEVIRIRSVLAHERSAVRGS